MAQPGPMGWLLRLLVAACAAAVMGPEGAPTVPEVISRLDAKIVEAGEAMRCACQQVHWWEQRDEGAHKRPPEPKGLVGCAHSPLWRDLPADQHTYLRTSMHVLMTGMTA